MIRTISELKKDWESCIMQMINEKPIGLPPNMFPEELEIAEINKATINGIKNELAHNYGIIAGHPRDIDNYLNE